MRPLDPRLLRRTRGGRTALAIDAALGVVAAALLLAQAVLLAAAIAAAFDHRDLAGVAGLVMWLALVVLARSLVFGAFESTGRRAAARIASELRAELVAERLRNASLQDDGTRAAELAAAAVQGVESLEPYFARYLPQLVLAVIVPALVLVWTAAIDLVSAFIMVVTLPLIPAFMVLIGRAAGARTRDRWEALARLSNHFLDVVSGLATLRAFNRGEAQADRIAATSEEYRATTMQVLRLSFLSGAVLDLVATLATALVAVALGIRLVQGEIGLRPALTVLLLTPELYAPLRALGAQFHASADGLAAAGKILDLIDSTARTSHSGTVRLGSWDVVRFEGIHFSYPGRPHAVLDNFDLELRRGEIVALVGPSGIGKSTVAALVLGLQLPGRGRVTIDGVDLQDIDLTTWRRGIGWLPQRPTLLRGSVNDNIRIGIRHTSERHGNAADPAADAAAIEHATRLAGADDFVTSLQLGGDTVVGEGGRGLSVGETRRVALARALAGKPSLLVLDEPTAGLDPASAAAVTAGIVRAAEDSSVLLIEHRPEAAAVADRIVRLQPVLGEFPSERRPTSAAGTRLTTRDAAP